MSTPVPMPGNRQSETTQSHLWQNSQTDDFQSPAHATITDQPSLHLQKIAENEMTANSQCRTYTIVQLNVSLIRIKESLPVPSFSQYSPCTELGRVPVCLAAIKGQGHHQQLEKPKPNKTNKPSTHSKFTNMWEGLEKQFFK